MAFALAAYPSVSVVGTFMNMTCWTRLSFATVAKDGKVFADRSSWVHANVCVATGRIGAFTTKEVQASRNSFWGRFMGEIAKFASGAAAGLEVLLAHGESVFIVDIRA
jgi:hypothetical protein